MPPIGDAARQVLLQYSLPILQESVQKKFELAMSGLVSIESDLGMVVISIRSSFEEVTILMREISKIGKMLKFDSVVLLEYEKKIPKSILNQALSIACAIIARVKVETKTSVLKIRLLAQILSSLDHLHSELWGEPGLVLFQRVDFSSDFDNCFKELILEIVTMLQQATCEILMQSQQADPTAAFEKHGAVSKKMTIACAVIPGLEMISGEALLYDVQATFAMLAQLQLKEPWNQ
ncbi:hypothetical protein MDAP_001739 [Mitosporidium daphniae]